MILHASDLSANMEYFPPIVYMGLFAWTNFQSGYNQTAMGMDILIDVESK